MKNGLQCLRKEKAVEHGAVVNVRYSAKTTHILCDKALSKTSLLRYLRKKSLREDIVVVNDAWVPQCLLHARLCDPRDPQFRIEGDSDGPEEEEKLSIPEFFTIKKPLPRKSPEKTQKSTTSNEDDDINSQETGHTFDEIVGQVKKSWSTQKGASAVLEEDHQDFNDDFSKPKAASSWVSSFVAAGPHTESSQAQNPNRTTIEVLERMKDHYEAEADQWRALGYRKAISTLKKTPYLVSTEAQASSLPGIGARIASKITTIVETGRLEQLTDLAKDPRTQAKRLFLGIQGVGHVKANEFVARGYTTLDDILQHGNPTRAQKLGIEHYTDLNTRIPRAEVQEHADYVYREMKKLDPRMEIHAMGSFRRGQSDCGDVSVFRSNHL